MKIIRSFFFAALAGCLGSVAQGQVLVLTGNVTTVTGTFQGIFSTGDAVKFSLDFTDVGEDIFKGQIRDEAAYFIKGALSIGGQNVPIPVPPNTFGGMTGSLHNSIHEGVSTGVEWGTQDNMWTIGQDFLSNEDILPSRSIFPAGLPLDNFLTTAGWYANFHVTDAFELLDIGRVRWEITDYTGSLDLVPPPEPPPLISPIPEPSIYGLMGALGLVGLALFRARKQSA